MNLQADEFATVDLCPEKSSINKGTKRPITSPRGRAQYTCPTDLRNTLSSKANCSDVMWFIEPSELGSHAQMIHPLLVLLLTFPDPKSGEKRLL